MSKKQDLRMVPAPSTTLCLLVVAQEMLKAACSVACRPHNEFLFVLEPQLLLGSSHAPCWD